MDPFDRPAWIGREVAPGVTEMDRPWPHVTFITGHPNVHLHYWADDAAIDERGYGITDLVCHGCGKATRVTFPATFIAPGQSERMRPLRDRFVAAHRGHVSIGGEFLCPPAYAISERVDLRTAGAPDSPSKP